MHSPKVTFWRLSQSGELCLGPSCDEEGLFLGRTPLLERAGNQFVVRDQRELERVMSAGYGCDVALESRMGGFRAVTKALNAGDLCRATIAAVMLRLPDLPSYAARQKLETEDWLVKVERGLWGKIIPPFDPQKHPRWPHGQSDGGRFRPVNDDAGPAPVAPKLVVAAAEGEDERDPRFGIGGNHPPPEELIPERLLQSPAGPVVQFLDNLLDITGPADEANLELYTSQMRALLGAIHDVDPNYVYESIEPEGGLAGMSWQGRRNVINGLQADLAAAIYRVRGDIRPLQEVTLEFMQRTANDAYDEAVEKYNAGELDIQLSREVAIGNYVDGIVRSQLRNLYYDLGIAMGPESAIRVNRRAYDTSDSPPSYRVPDARVGNLIFDVSLEAKKPSKDQIRDFFNADFAPVGVVIVRPNQLGNNSSYIIWRNNGN